MTITTAILAFLNGHFWAIWWLILGVSFWRAVAATSIAAARNQ